jgi:polyphosphate glucokinase
MGVRERPRTLAIDIGGSGIKALRLDPRGRPAGERMRVATPRPATPRAMIAAIERVARAAGAFDRIAVGFPGVIVNGEVRSATNLDPSWVGVNLETRLRRRLGKPVRAANDADVQGMAVIEGRGVELVVTLGTGVGTSLFVDGRLVPNLEMGQHVLRRGQSYEELLGDRARRRAGPARWNRRLRRAVEALAIAFNFRRLYLGGGNARHVTRKLPERVTIVGNLAGLLGGIRLWAKPAAAVRVRRALSRPAASPSRPRPRAAAAARLRTNRRSAPVRARPAGSASARSVRT